MDRQELGERTVVRISRRHRGVIRTARERLHLSESQAVRLGLDLLGEILARDLRVGDVLAAALEGTRSGTVRDLLEAASPAAAAAKEADGAPRVAAAPRVPLSP